MNTIIKASLGMLVSCYMHGTEQERSFLQGDLSEFTKRVSSDIALQKKFVEFYTEINKQLWSKGDEARKKGWHHFTNLSLERLPLDHPDWYSEIKPFLSNPLTILDSQFNEMRTSIRFFLTRYGAWCEFIGQQEASPHAVVVQTQSSHEQTVWDSIRSSVTYVAHSVKESFNYVYDKVTA